MRCTQLFDGRGAAEVVALPLGFAVEDGERGVDGVDEDVDVLLGIRDVEAGDVLLVVEDPEPSPCVLPPEEHPARTNPATAQALAARTNGREAATARR